MVLKDSSVKARDVHWLLQVWILQKALKYAIAKKCPGWAALWEGVVSDGIAGWGRSQVFQSTALHWYSSSIMTLNVHSTKQSRMLIAPVGAHEWCCPQYWSSAWSHVAFSGHTLVGCIPKHQVKPHVKPTVLPWKNDIKCLWVTG